MSKYDSRLTLLFLVEADGPAYLSKPEEFSLQLCLIEGGLLLPPDVKAVINGEVWLPVENTNCRKIALFLHKF